MMLDNEEVTIYFFVTSIGASELAYVEPFLDMSTESYIAGNVHALRYYGAVPKVLVPDNCKTAVIRNKDKEVDLKRNIENSIRMEITGDDLRLNHKANLTTE